MSQYHPPCCLSAMCSSNWARESCHGGLWKQAPVNEGTSHYTHTWVAALPQGETRRDRRSGRKVRRTQEHNTWICCVLMASNGSKLPRNSSVTTNPSTKLQLHFFPYGTLKCRWIPRPQGLAWELHCAGAKARGSLEVLSPSSSSDLTAAN